MADTVAEPKETTTVEESVTSSVKESPVKKDTAETNGTSEPAENGNGTEAVEEKEEVAENGDAAEENGTKENGDVTDSKEETASIKRKSCTGEADAPEVPTPEKKAKVSEEPTEETKEKVAA